MPWFRSSRHFDRPGCLATLLKFIPLRDQAKAPKSQRCREVISRTTTGLRYHGSEHLELVVSGQSVAEIFPVFRKERFCLTVPLAGGFPLPVLRAKDVRVVGEAVARRWSTRWCHGRLAGRRFGFRGGVAPYVVRLGSNLDVVGRFQSRGARSVGGTHREERIGLDEAARSDDAVAADRDRRQDTRPDPKHVVRADRGTLDTCLLIVLIS